MIVIQRNESELHFDKPIDPIPSVEIDVMSLEETGKDFPDCIQMCLSRYAIQNKKASASVYINFIVSLNFNNKPTTSAFIVPAGNIALLKYIHSYFSGIKGVSARFSEYMNPKECTLDYHIEDGALWVQYDYNDDYTEMLWSAVEFTSNNDSIANDENNSFSTGDDLVAEGSTIETLKKSISKMYKIPKKSIVFVDPGGFTIRANAKLSTLRERWGEH